MKLIATRDAVGHVLCHDLTRIVPGVTKDAAFRKGHIVTQEDIPMLLSMERTTSMSGKNGRGFSTKTKRQSVCGPSVRIRI